MISRIAIRFSLEMGFLVVGIYSLGNSFVTQVNKCMNGLLRTNYDTIIIIESKTALFSRMFVMYVFF